MKELRVSESCPTANGRRERSVVPTGPHPLAKTPIQIWLVGPLKRHRRCPALHGWPGGIWEPCTRQSSIRIVKGGPGISVGGPTGLNPYTATNRKQLQRFRADRLSLCQTRHSRARNIGRKNFTRSSRRGEVREGTVQTCA